MTRPLHHRLRNDRGTGGRGASRKRMRGGRGTASPGKDVTPHHCLLRRKETERGEDAAARRRGRPHPRVLQAGAERGIKTPSRRVESERVINGEREPAPATHLFHLPATRHAPMESRKRRREPGRGRSRDRKSWRSSEEKSGTEMLKRDERR